MPSLEGFGISPPCVENATHRGTFVSTLFKNGFASLSNNGGGYHHFAYRQEDDMADTDAETTGLQRFVFSYYMENTLIWASDRVPVIKKHHKTLSVLYLHFDNKLLDTRFLLLLAHYGMPQLRELYLYSEGTRREPIYIQYFIYPKEMVLSLGGALSAKNPLLSQAIGTLRCKKPSFSQAIVTLASRCPLLRIFHLVQKNKYRPNLYEINYQAMSSILLDCPFLNQLKNESHSRTFDVRG